VAERPVELPPVLKGDAVTTAAEYRQFAKECVESACAAASDDIRKQFLDIAKLWMEAADKMDAAKSQGAAGEEGRASGRTSPATESP
jgi:hypothetical protein